MGNIGNQMFIYAMARALQLKYRDSMFIDLRGLKRHYYTAAYKLDQFDLPEDITYNLNDLSIIQRVKFGITSRIFHLQHFYYRRTRDDLIIPQRIIDSWFSKGCYYNTNRPLKIYGLSSKKDKYLYGYFQSESYFKEYSEMIKKDFTVKTPVSERDRALIERMNSCNSVGVSIRANKTPENPKVKDNVSLGFMTKDFYYEGMKLMAQKVENPEFFIFADDMDIVKKEYNFPFPVTYVEPEDSATGMRLLYSCKHFVIANSTFSWWGAYLGRYPQKEVIMPTPWDRYGPLRECIYMENATRIPCEFED